MDITDTSALVTGAASGLGAATAAMLASRGVRVTGLDLPAGLERAPAVDGVSYVAADVTDQYVHANPWRAVGIAEDEVETVTSE